MIQKTTIKKCFLVIISLFITYGCEKENKEKTWVMKVTLNKYIAYVYDTIPSEVHSGVSIICQNETKQISAITDSLGIVVLEGLDYGIYDITLKMKDTKKLYCSREFNENGDTLEMNLFMFQKDTLIEFVFINEEEKVGTVIKVHFEGEYKKRFSFLYYFFSNNPNVSTNEFGFLQTLMIDGAGYLPFRFILEDLMELGYKVNDSVYFKVYAGNPNVSTCLRDGTEETYYYGFSDSTEVFGFVMPG